MSWALSAQVTKDQDLDIRLEQATHEVRSAQPVFAEDIEAAMTAAKALSERIDGRPLFITLTGHRDQAKTYINVNVTS